MEKAPQFLNQGASLTSNTIVAGSITKDQGIHQENLIDSVGYWENLPSISVGGDRKNKIPAVFQVDGLVTRDLGLTAGILFQGKCLGGGEVEA